MNWEFIISTGIVEGLKGIPISLFVTVGSLVIALPLGFLCAMIRFQNVPVISQIISAVVSFLRGSPLVIQVFIVYSGLPSILNRIVLAAGWDIDVFHINRYWYVFTVFSLNSAAYLTEVFRSALSSVSKDQMEACLSVGLNRFQAHRLVIIPQALVSAIPNLCNQILELFKSTSLVYMMSILDITGRLRIAAASGYNYTEAYFLIFLIYMAIGFGMEKLFTQVENNLKTYKALPQ